MGEAIYEIGVEDDGVPAGLSDEDLKSSLETVEKMAKQINADTSGMQTTRLLKYNSIFQCIIDKVYCF